MIATLLLASFQLTPAQVLERYAERLAKAKTLYVRMEAVDAKGGQSIISQLWMEKPDKVRLTMGSAEYRIMGRETLQIDHKARIIRPGQRYEPSFAFHPFLRKSEFVEPQMDVKRDFTRLDHGRPAEVSCVRLASPHRADWALFLDAQTAWPIEEVQYGNGTQHPIRFLEIHLGSTPESWPSLEGYRRIG